MIALACRAAWAALTSRLGLATVGVGAICLCLVLGLNLGKAHKAIRDLKADLVTTNEAWGKCRSDLALEKTNALELRGALEAQNEAVRVWKLRADQLQADAERKVARARQEAAQYRAEAKRIMAARAKGPDRCAAASQLYLQAFGAGQ